MTKNERWIKGHIVKTLHCRAEHILAVAELKGFVVVEFDDSPEDYEAKEELKETVESTGGIVFQDNNPYVYCYVLDGYRKLTRED